MKVISMVPSWTEMLIECGVNVVGRTRFCLHPDDICRNISIVGGTKDLDFDKLRTLNADLLILDQEENLPWMKEQSPIPVVVSHVTSVANVSSEIHKIAQALTNPPQKLIEMEDRWRRISERQKDWSWERIPGELEKLKKTHAKYEKLVYVIWRKPWMAVSKQTFIGSMLSHLGAEAYLPHFDKKYPNFELKDFDLEKTYFLFSSEPFPFHKKKAELVELGLEGSVVDGESFSWFGSRSLRFLESL